MQCYFCGSPKTLVVDSGLTADNYVQRRRHECSSCREWFSSLEVVVAARLLTNSDDNRPLRDHTWSALVETRMPEVSIEFLLDEIRERILKMKPRR